MINDDGGFMRRETAADYDLPDLQCEECDKVIGIDEEDDAVYHGLGIFCSEGCKEDNIIWRCEMQYIARHERHYD